ncbi:DUF397 domain-containing protein [Streptomyces sp. CdTB01]|uniref:DUF397 domain-containing protein n=1 Tax=Streptomyces sp. CdTB01 TaxID=1725411 RepID=UPI00099E2F8B|nr:DUF397 domain-containing protein [Streptomyces sp. CdTB01]
MSCRYSGRGAACPHPGWRGGVGGSWSWRKSSASGGGNNECVEVAWTGEAVLVRDSNARPGPVITFAPTAWQHFLQAFAPHSDEPEARP